jgi:hypothetical protein
MVISVSDYSKKFANKKIVTIEDGVDFEIKQISPIKLLEAQKAGDNMAEQVKVILLNGVVAPAICIDKEDGKLSIEDINTEHLTKLVNEIMIFSGYMNEDGTPKGFFSNAKKPLVSTE